MFAFSEKPWLTQTWTRRILSGAYGTGVCGLCGNEDCGQMSAWYVLSAIGLHPNCPGDGRWYLTAPLFTEASIRLDADYYPGGTLTIRVPNAGLECAYIRAVRLNGRPLGRLWVETREIARGGVLEIDLESRCDGTSRLAGLSNCGGGITCISHAIPQRGCGIIRGKGEAR